MKNNVNQKIIVMPREMRLMTERIFNLTPLPIGFTRMLWDIVMYSEAIGLGCFKMLEDKLSLFIEANIHKIRILSVDKNKFVLDCGNQRKNYVYLTFL